jgi:hypothetical protein
MVHSLGCGLGVLDMLGAALRNEVARKTLELIHKERPESLEKSAAWAGKAVVSEDAARYPELKSATRALEDCNLVVVQYTTLDGA